METKDKVETAALNSSKTVEPTISSTSTGSDLKATNPAEQGEVTTETTMQQASSKTTTKPAEASTASPAPATKKLVTPTTEKSRMLVPTKQVASSITATRTIKSLNTTVNSTPLAVSKIKRAGTVESNKSIASKNLAQSTTSDATSISKYTPRKPITKIAATIRPTKTAEPAISKQGNYCTSYKLNGVPQAILKL